MSVKTVTSVSKRLGILFLFLLFIAVISIASSQTTFASGEQYSWDGPDKIKMEGGSLPAPASLTVTVNSAGTMTAVGEAVLFEDSDRICRTTVFLNIDSAPFKTGSIAGVKTIPGAGGDGDQEVSCSESEQATIDAWPGSTISITGNRGGAETAKQKQINVHLINPKKKSDSPSSVKFTLKNESGGEPRSFTSNIGGDGDYYGSFPNVAPGNYTVCANKIATKCEAVIKIPNKAVDVYLGESAESQLLRVRVVIEEGVPVETFKIDLKKNDEVVRSQTTDTPGTTDDLDFLGVEPGNYKVCYKDRCESAVKEESKSLLVILNISKADADDAAGDGDGETTSCALEGVGWMVCPVALFLGTISDQLFNFLKTLLVVEARMFSTTNDSYRAWEVMRNLANVAFVVAFLIIIYSQITGGGLSNYGIKKMLPRIIIAAILVNVSYWLCAIAVDISNILGSSLQSLLNDARGSVSAGSATSADNALTGSGEFTAWVLGGGTAALAIGGVTLAALGSGGFLAALALLLPILVTILFAFITVILVLAGRQAIIIILIVISPLAFVAYLLPNTEQYFEKWRKLFFTLLILFPIIAVVFGGSQLAAAVIRASTTSATVYLLSLAVQAVPLFVTPLVLKFSGGLLNRFGGIINNPSKGPFDRLRKGAEGVRDRQGNKAKNAAINSSSNKNPFRRYLRRQARTEAVDASQKQGFEAGKAGYISGQAQNNSKFLGQMAAGGGSGATNRALANAINIQLELNAKEVKAASAVIDHLNLSSSQKADLATGRRVTAANGTVLDGSNADAQDLRMAAQQAVVKSGDAEQINRVVDHMSSLNAGEASQAHELNNFASALESSSLKPAYIQPGDLENMKQNGIGGVSAGDSASMLTQALADNVYSAAKMSQTGRQEMGVVLNHAVTLAAGDPGRVQLAANAVEVLGDGRLNVSLGKQKSVVESISRL